MLYTSPIEVATYTGYFFPFNSTSSKHSTQRLFHTSKVGAFISNDSLSVHATKITTFSGKQHKEPTRII